MCWLSGAKAKVAAHLLDVVTPSTKPCSGSLIVPYFSPVVRIFAKPTENADLALLTCHVTSTDRSVSTVHLIGDGASRVSWISRIGPMPSEDQSVILRLTAGISLSRNADTYSCTVQTQGHNITEYWGETFWKLFILFESKS